MGERGGDLAGASVAQAGDFDGDGRSDTIVGAPLADPLGRTDAGAAYVVFGGGPRGRIALGHLAAGCGSPVPSRSQPGSTIAAGTRSAAAPARWSPGSAT